MPNDKSGTSGSMSGDGKRSVAEWPKLPRPSSTLPNRTSRDVRSLVAIEGWSQPVDATLYLEGEMECGLMGHKFHRGFTATEKTELWDQFHLRFGVTNIVGVPLTFGCLVAEVD